MTLTENDIEGLKNRMQTHSSNTTKGLSLQGARRVVVKIGSALLVEDATGTIRTDWMDKFAQDISRLRKSGVEVAIVTSGAISIGRRQLGLVGRVLKLEEKQAAASVGQIRLAQSWQEALSHHALSVGQILVTLDDTEGRKRHLNARATINALMRLGVIPLINENDTIATDEIRFGDNDRLAARVSQMISADTLVLLSDIDGLYTADPRKDKDARLINVVHNITPEIEAMADKPPPGFSSGGMITKIQAARIALAAGCRMVIAFGRVDHPLAGLMKSVEEGGANCTWFLSSKTPLNARKKWIASHIETQGVVVIDEGASSALLKGKSLLPAGVTAIEGDFDRGDVVLIKSREGHPLARGLAAYSSAEAQLIRGHHSGEIDAILGDFGGRDVMIHRDDLVLFNTPDTSEGA